ncbi:Fatty acid desaturase 4, chloroplastic [Dionaea muscipula]
MAMFTTLHHHKHHRRPNHLAAAAAASTTSCHHHHRDHLPIRTACTLGVPTKPTLTPTNKQQLTIASCPPPAIRGSPHHQNHHHPSLHLQSTWTHRAWLATGCSTVLVSLAKSVMLANTAHAWIEPTLAGLMGYLLADLVSGIYHWGIDNYGDPSTPFFGGQIEAFQGHHRWPWTITRRQLANNLHALARIITFAVLPFDMASDDPTLLGFVSVFSGCFIFSQQFHAWAHSTKSKLPPLVVALQDRGVLVSRSQHADHHRPPYDDNYCIVSGVWNRFLDENKVFEAAEMVLFFRFGVRPRSWSEVSFDWTEETT